ncbi:MAG: LytR/AlgR family response regulator transcription factor, partial [Longimicrobiales bacterium]
MKIRTLIVEDEPLARERIHSLLRGERDIEIVGDCGDGNAAVGEIRGRQPDLVFLDVNIPELNGFEVIEEVGLDQMPPVVFVTAYDQYAVQAFDAHALDYILKPFDEERFRTAVTRARESIQRQSAGSIDRRLSDLLDDLRRPRYLERLAVKSGGKIIFLRTEELE